MLLCWLLRDCWLVPTKVHHECDLSLTEGPHTSTEQSKAFLLYVTHKLQGATTEESTTACETFPSP